MIWDADEGCEHVWGDEQTKKHEFQCNLGNNSSFDFSGQGRESKTSSQGQFCQLCGAWRGSLGLEPTPELFIQHIVEIFREVKRVLRKDGTVWLNLGDSYASGKGDCFNPGGGTESFAGIAKMKGTGAYPLSRGNVSDLKKSGLKPKDLCEIPSDVVRALRADGWWLRSRMPWVKRSAMPESAEDRPASALEYVFLLTKSQKYYFDMDAVRMPHVEPWRAHGGPEIKKQYAEKNGMKVGKGNAFNDSVLRRGRDYNPTGRNFRNTDLFYQSIQPPHGMIFAGDEPVGLDVNPYPMKDAHFATFPPKLVEPCILAGTSEKGCCPECGAPWERCVEKKPSTMNIRVRDNKKGTIDKKSGIQDKYKASITEIENYGKEQMGESKTIGWKPTCKCKHEVPTPNGYGYISPNPIPCTVLDPFLGSNTVGVVAHKHGRNFTGIELSLEYLDDIAIPRIEKETAQMKMF